jgi:YHS domain-containing protein
MSLKLILASWIKAAGCGSCSEKRSRMSPVSIDRVCGMKVASGTARWSTEYNATAVYFCCQSCQEKFEANPGQYVEVALLPSAAISSVAAARYTCPMPPELVRDEPGGVRSVGWRLSRWLCPALPITQSWRA